MGKNMKDDEHFGGTGSYQNIGDAVTWLRHINPESVLDVGCGFGRWGFLTREFLEIWNGRVKRSLFKVRLVGVDAWEGNFSNHHKLFYDELHGKTIQRFLSDSDEKFDLVILGDVIEHLTKSEAYEVVDKCLDRAGYVLMVVPIGSQWEQDDLYDNIYEKHLAVWEVEDVDQFNPLAARLYHDYIGRPFLMTVLSRNDNAGIAQKLTGVVSSDVLKASAKKSNSKNESRDTSDIKQKLHVALVSPELTGVNESGGIGTYIRHLASILEGGGHSVSIITLSNTIINKLSGKITVHGIAESDVLPPQGHAMSSLERNMNWGEAIYHKLHQIHSEQAIDVIEVTDFFLENLFLKGERVLQGKNGAVPVITHMHGPLSYVLALNRMAFPQIYEDLDSYNLRDAGFTKSNSPQWRDMVNRLWPGSNCSFVRAPLMLENGVNVDRSGPFEWDLLYFGRLEYRKGIVPLVEALKMLKPGRKIKVALVGKDLPMPNKPVKMSQFVESELAGHKLLTVEILPAVPHGEIPSILAKAKTAIFPSLWESLGYTPIEAMAEKVPTMLSVKSGINYVVPDSLRDTLLIDVDSPADIAGKITNLLGLNDDQLAQIGSKMNSVIREEFNEKLILADTVSYYHECISERSAVEALPAFADKTLMASMRYLTKYSSHASANTTRMRSMEMRNLTLGYMLNARDAEKGTASQKLIDSVSSLKPHQRIERVQHHILLFSLFEKSGWPASLPAWQAIRHEITANVYLVIAAASALAEGGMEEQCGRLVDVLIQQGNLAPVYNIASTLKSAGKLEPAARYFETLLNEERKVADSMRGGAYYHLGEIEYLRGNTAGSLKHLKNCLTLVPNHGKASSLKDQLQTG